MSANSAVAACDVENPVQRSSQRMKGILALLPSSLEQWSGEPICLADIVQSDDVVVVMLLDAKQPYSLRLFKRLCRMMRDMDTERIHIVVAMQQWTESFPALATQQQRPTYMIPIDERFGMWKMALGFSACPALAVVDCESGRKFSHNQEELAVLWNEDGKVTNDWLRRQSALSNLQLLQAALLFPNCIVQ